MYKIKKFNKFITEEINFRDILITIGSFLSLGLNEVDAQQIKKYPEALPIIDTCNDYNNYIKQSKTDDEFNNKKLLINKLQDKVNNPVKFIDDHIQFLPDKTIVISPKFIKGLKFNVNPENKELSLNYKINF